MPVPADILCAIIRNGAAPGMGEGWTPDAWLRLVDAAQSHGVAGLFQRALATGGAPAMPDVARRRLQAHVYAAVGQNLRLYQALAAALAALAPVAPVILLKGAALGPSLYPALALRPLSDIDLLVPPEAAGQAIAALVRCGFRPLPRIAPELARAVEPHAALVGGPSGESLVELHWGLVAGSADWRAAPLDWFLQQTEPWPPPQPYLAAGGPSAVAMQLSPAAALLYQAAHLVLQHGHGPARLIWIYDLHLLAGHPRLDWDALLHQARALGWAAVLARALDQARRCFHTPLPPAALAALGEPIDRRASFYGPASAGSTPSTTWSALAQLNLPTRLHMLARLAFPAPAYLRAQYAPRWGACWPLAYPYRWLRLPLRLLRTIFPGYPLLRRSRNNG